MRMVPEHDFHDRKRYEKSEERNDTGRPNRPGIAGRAMDQLSYMIDTRRHLHRHPCLSGREEETAAWLSARLEELGYRPRMAAEGTGLYCDLSAGEGKPFILLRADIDALPLQ